MSVNGGERTLTMEAGRPLLFGLMSAGTYIPSACGGRGSCGQCRVRISEGAPPHNQAEALLISEADQRLGIHLSCQIRPDGPLSIEIPRKHFAARQHAASVVRVRELTWEIREITLDVTGAGGFSFVAGQYIQVFLPGSESSPEPLFRAYSMASPPSSPGILTLFVRREPGGVVSPYLCDRLHEGDTLAIRGPFGDFRMHESHREILFVAGGSGLAPLMSMLLEMAEKAESAAPHGATLYFSARSKRDIFNAEELRALEGRLPGFRFIPALSNPLPGDAWDGERGGITAVLNRRLGPLDNHEAYLCGSAGMIDAAVRVLRLKGLAEELIFFDKFL
ncbi:MAG: 2Fe-2S iron-sulfur cluster binding domain-containing protein [Spirochaetia bacterium]